MDDQNKTTPSDTPANNSDKSADAGTGTVFSPANADPTVNPYDLAAAPASTPSVGSPPPVFAQPAMPASDTPTPSIGAAKPARPMAVPPAQAPAPAPAPEPPAAPTTPQPAVDSDLLSIKQAALQNLTPLIDELPQSPEDKFKTMMMLIQASDNPALIKRAYDAAGAIPDEKARAQALLDVVNEINYFTQQQQPPAGPSPTA